MCGHILSTARRGRHHVWLSRIFLEILLENLARGLVFAPPPSGSFYASAPRRKTMSAAPGSKRPAEFSPEAPSPPKNDDVPKDALPKVRARSFTTRTRILLMLLARDVRWLSDVTGPSPYVQPDTPNCSDAPMSPLWKLSQIPDRADSTWNVGLTITAQRDPENLTGAA